MNGTLTGITHKVGDVVVVDETAGFPRNMNGVRYVVTNVPRGARGVNYTVAPCDADGNRIAGRGARGPAYAFVPFDADKASATEVEYVPNPAIGSIVTPTTPHTPEGLYVVIGETDAERVRIVPLGGDERGRYWRAYSRRLRVLDPAELHDALVDLI